MENTQTSSFPGEFEQMVLLAILQLGSTAYAINMRNFLTQHAHRSVSRGALYRTLDRMVEKGYITWSVEEPTEDRGGHHRRLYAVSDRGLGVLRSSRSALLTLWEGLEPVLEESSL